ncbi:Scr1 family TA system antitoxin-like transcriptional regulator [Actinokineospora soli]|uniref:Scr1 family TA system antitoxin-like transcriptional regulator n=1 Tax=Actinokineospora soli TaxID=1048753 RepID=A0ABW2TNS2_9PSEU
MEVLTTHLGYRHRLPYLAKLLGDARKRATGPRLDGIARHGELAIGLYQTATKIVAFDTYLVNPALRARAYSSALHAFPVRICQTSEVTWYVDESVLLRTIGNATVMRDQYTHLAAALDNHRVTVQIVSSEHLPPGLTGAFTLFELDNHSIVYEETNSIAIYHDAPEIIESYRAHVSAVDSRALEKLKSRAFIDALIAGASN